MRPLNLNSKIFLDSGDPQETIKILEQMGFLDGQTINPTNIANNPAVKDRLGQGKKFTKDELLEFYKNVTCEISREIPDGSVSIEVYADHETSAEKMLAQGEEIFQWIKNAHIQYPITPSGLLAANKSIEKDIRVNMTLCFSQEQAAAVCAATKGAALGDVFLSPSVGRLDDDKKNGMSLLINILRMLREQNDNHLALIASNMRTIEQFLFALELRCDIVSAPFEVLAEWASLEMPIPDYDYDYDPKGLKDIPYQTLDLSQDWKKFDVFHALTDEGIAGFARDWNNLLA